MKNTEKIIKEIVTALNTSEKSQEVMEMLVNRANAIGMSAEDFDKAKQYIVLNLFYQVVSNDKDLMRLVATDVYNLYNN